MRNGMMRLGVVGLSLALVAPGLSAQASTPEPDPMVRSIQAGAIHIRQMFTVAAEQMSEEDYAFRPTPEVRSFGELLGHVAQSNYMFCAGASGETAPVSDIEKTVTNRAALQKVLAESFAYCEAAFTAMADPAKANRMVDFMGRPMPALATLNFRNYHSLLHWGNAITYMRLRGKVPPAA